jgi:hypothetical protein
MITALGIDPGGTTGWAAVSVREIAMLNRRDLIPGLEYECGQITGDYNAQAKELLSIIDEFNCPVVMEDFHLRKKHVELSPVEIAARVEFALSMTDELDKYYKQTPGDAKKTCSDARLKQWGLWLPHKERHARDGIRHALLFLRRCQAEPRLLEEAYAFAA